MTTTTRSQTATARRTQTPSPIQSAQTPTWRVAGLLAAAGPLQSALSYPTCLHVRTTAAMMAARQRCATPQRWYAARCARTPPGRTTRDAPPCPASSNERACASCCVRRSFSSSSARTRAVSASTLMSARASGLQKPGDRRRSAAANLDNSNGVWCVCRGGTVRRVAPLPLRGTAHAGGRLNAHSCSGGENVCGGGVGRLRRDAAGADGWQRCRGGRLPCLSLPAAFLPSSPKISVLRLCLMHCACAWAESATRVRCCGVLCVAVGERRGSEGQAHRRWQEGCGQEGRCEGSTQGQPSLPGNTPQLPCRRCSPGELNVSNGVVCARVVASLAQRLRRRGCAARGHDICALFSVHARICG
jgi:hypothetical protein